MNLLLVLLSLTDILYFGLSIGVLLVLYFFLKSDLYKSLFKSQTKGEFGDKFKKKEEDKKIEPSPGTQPITPVKPYVLTDREKAILDDYITKVKSGDPDYIFIEDDVEYRRLTTLDVIIEYLDLDKSSSFQISNSNIEPKLSASIITAGFNNESEMQTENENIYQFIYALESNLVPKVPKGPKPRGDDRGVKYFSIINHIPILELKELSLKLNNGSIIKYDNIIGQPNVLTIPDRQNPSGSRAASISLIFGYNNRSYQIEVAQ